MINLAETKIDRLDTEIMLAELLGISRAELYLYDNKIGQDLIDKFQSFVERRAGGEPLQYILGKAEFMGLEFEVTPDVLIPRPETELLVEEAIKTLRSTLYAIRSPCILDLGTGSGNIAISLTKFITDCKIIASDISEKALAVARRNAQQLLPLTLTLSPEGRGNKILPPLPKGEREGVRGNIRFILSDLFNGLNGYKFDIIISNPPYVAGPEFAGLEREIGFEPALALDGGEDGLDFYRRIIKEASPFLSDGGGLFLEIGLGQADYVQSLFEKYNYKNIRFIEDYSDIKRIAAGTWIN
jgi:release factor glutamine methyltransferase